MDNLLIQIAQGGIAFSILVAVVVYLKAQLKKKDEEIAKLNQDIRDSEKENLTILFRVVGYMERGEKNFEDLKTFIADKIESLRDVRK
jgi:hypothetical protein